MRPPPTRGDLERKCWRSWVGTGSASPAKRHAVPCLTTGERGGRESGQKVVLRFGRDPRPDRTSLRQRRLPFNHASLLAYFAKSRRKLAVQRPHHAVVSLALKAQRCRAAYAFADEQALSPSLSWAPIDPIDGALHR